MTAAAALVELWCMVCGRRVFVEAPDVTITGADLCNTVPVGIATIRPGHSFPRHAGEQVVCPYHPRLHYTLIRPPTRAAEHT